jgi:hypothetical protein
MSRSGGSPEAAGAGPGSRGAALQLLAALGSVFLSPIVGRPAGLSRWVAQVRPLRFVNTLLITLTSYNNQQWNVKENLIKLTKIRTKSTKVFLKFPTGRK